MRTHWVAPGLLAAKLARNEISNREVAQFMLGNFLLGIAIAYSALTWANPQWTLLSLWEAVLLVIITVLGMMHCYDAAGGDANSRFAAEFNCLTFPIWMWTTIVVWSTSWIVLWVYRKWALQLVPADSAYAAIYAYILERFGWFATMLAIVASQLFYFVWMKRMMASVQARRHDR